MTNGLSLEELMKEEHTRRNILKGKTGKYYMEIH